MANPPLPPVSLPSSPGSLNCQPPLVPEALITLQPAGAEVVESKVWVGPVSVSL